MFKYMAVYFFLVYFISNDFKEISKLKKRKATLPFMTNPKGNPLYGSIAWFYESLQNKDIDPIKSIRADRISSRSIG